MGYHVNWLPEKVNLFEMDADYWKSWVHQRLETPIDMPGAMTFYRAPSQEHMTLVKHLTAERKSEEFVAGKGVVTRWERVRKATHFLDCMYNAAVAGYQRGARLPDEPPLQPKPRLKLSTIQGFKRPDGRPWIDMERWNEMQSRTMGL